MSSTENRTEQNAPPFRRRWGKVLRAALPATVPVMTGYLCLGFAYGLLMEDAGLGAPWVALFSLVVFGGSVQFVGLQLLAAPFAPLQAFFISLMVSARHIFYGLSFLEKYRRAGRARPFLIFSLTDETFSILSTLHPPEGVEEADFCLAVSALDYLYWAAGGILGALLGSVVRFNTAGMDFALTALFIVLFLEQIKKRAGRIAGFLGLGCAAASRALFGADNLVIPAMVLILASLLAGRRRIVS